MTHPSFWYYLFFVSFVFIVFIVINGVGVGVLIVMLTIPLMVTLLLLVPVVAPTNRDVKISPGSVTSRLCLRDVY